MNFLKNITNIYKNLNGNKYFEFIKVVVISLAIIIPIRTYLVEPYYVKGTSMLPNYHDYDYLLINKLKYRLENPQRGDVVVAKFAPTKPYVIKRVIGLPGDSIVLEDKKVIITETDGNSYELEEPYLDPDNLKLDDLQFELGDEQYLLMGDNRRVSLDSRQQGPINIDHIKGRVLIKAFNFEPVANIFHKIVPFSNSPLTS